ncbi:hypothetical protein AJ80_00656 [Polytolypa hystricis UAMH7299]|uniref:MYND-type domain-containing protein n=1 Tax=Polytolypa hystricis (strain UAMH7299) TaxID=1447883 RepID=A0A2B7Z337_POLH7|nr:hypothetical protein AJ80_00656 [Polytolypa hystricis UAMH7299]
MGSPVVLNLFSILYPLGNTPAVCLTDALPGEEDADILLLGCGDVRNILFTSYADQFSTRNVLLFTLLLDDISGAQTRLIWNIYYHFYLDHESLNLVVGQAKKLCGLSTSLKDWHGSQYGRLLRFCDSKTLGMVRALWLAYAATPRTGTEKKSYDKNFENAIQKMIAMRKGSSFSLIGCRATSPIALPAMAELPGLFDDFWKHGTTDESPTDREKTKHPNPLFAMSDASIHYGLDPLQGFHLAVAYAPLSPESPLHPETCSGQLSEMARAARLQFAKWGSSFRACARTMTVRFVIADALSFCYTLQHMAATKEPCANWYHDPYHSHVLSLDGPDYAHGASTYVTFNVIETSNLFDRLGGISLLVAASPLLRYSLSSTLYTESMVTMYDDFKSLLDDHLCGDFLSVSTLLGLFPVECWTNSSIGASTNEVLLAASITGDGFKKSNFYNRQVWKRSWPDPALYTSQERRGKLGFHPRDLAQLLFQIYSNMFSHENVHVLLAKVDIFSIGRNSNPRHHRGGFAKFLQYVKERVLVNWVRTMDALVTMIMEDSDLMIGRIYLQELFVHLYMFDVFKVPISTALDQSLHLTTNDFRRWKDIPPVVCVTLRAPRSELKVFTDRPATELGTPYVNGVVESVDKSWKHQFCAVRHTFGDLTTSGSRDVDDFALNIKDDPLGWKGKSHLLVSFYVPSWILLQGTDNTLVGFVVQSTPHSVGTFFKILGFEMSIFSSHLLITNDVYISKHPPNQVGFPSRPQRPMDHTPSPQQEQKAFHTIIKVRLDFTGKRITGFAARIALISDKLRALLSNEKELDLKQTSPCAISVVIGSNGVEIDVQFPAPVLESRSILRVARKASYLEIISDIIDRPDQNGFPGFMFPLFVEKSGPVVWHMPHINVARLPIVDINKSEKLEWLVPHLSLMFSRRERKLRARSMSRPLTPHDDARLDFKDSLFSLFMHFTGIQGRKCHGFGLHCSTAGGVQIVILVSSLRLDMSSRSVGLDSAVLVLTHEMVVEITPFLHGLNDLGLCLIKVGEEELKVWKQVLPAFVERIRQWKHRPTCEYSATSRIPLSVEPHKPVICSCGNGVMPPNFIKGVPRWEMAAKYAVRALISPVYPAPYIESPFDAMRPSKHAHESPKTPTRRANPANGLGGLESPSPASRASECATCQMEKSSDGSQLMNCSRCKRVKYCSVACQRAHWKEHKNVCGT